MRGVESRLAGTCAGGGRWFHGSMEPGDWVVVAFVLVVPGSLFLVLWLGRKAGFERNARLREMAARLGIEYSESQSPLKFMPAEPAVGGRIGGRKARIHEFSTGSGKSRTRWVAARVECIAPGPLRISMRSQGPALFEKFAGVFGYKDIVVGDAAFDSVFAIEGNDEAFIKAALIPEIRHKLVAFWPKARGGRITVADGEAVYEEMGSLTGIRAREHVEKAFPVLGDMAAIAEVHRR